MKKTYSNPTIKVVKIQPMQMIAASPYGKDVKEGSASSEYETLSRRGRFSRWDDEFEE